MPDINLRCTKHARGNGEYCERHSEKNVAADHVGISLRESRSVWDESNRDRLFCSGLYGRGSEASGGYQCGFGNAYCVSDRKCVKQQSGNACGGFGG